MKKEQLKKLYIESKRSDNNEDFLRVLKKQMQDALGSFGFEIDCFGALENLGTKKKKILINTTTILLKRGREFYMTRRINALIDFIFSTTPEENTLFDIIYNRI
jgi:hypothetical protein